MRYTDIHDGTEALLGNERIYCIGFFEPLPELGGEYETGAPASHWLDYATESREIVVYAASGIVAENVRGMFQPIAKPGTVYVPYTVADLVEVPPIR